jgi:acetolactate synthase-1/2/3 large subunit
MLANAKKPIIYSGGGIINSGPEASHLLREFARPDRISRDLRP